MSDETKVKGTLEKLVPVILDALGIVETEMDKIRDEILDKERRTDGECVRRSVKGG